MILEVSVVLTLLGLFWVLGRVLLLTCGAQEHDWLAAPLGLCLVGLGANALYFGLNLPVHVIRGALGVVAVMCAVLLIRARLSRQVWGHLLVLVAVFLVLALPAALSGPQYYVFRGNHWDQFNYINQTLAVWANPASEYQHMAPTNFLDRDVLAYGVKWINLRPAVALTAALVMPGRVICTCLRSSTSQRCGRWPSRRSPSRGGNCSTSTASRRRDVRWSWPPHSRSCSASGGSTSST